jgi:hypothetical protein
MEVKMKLLSEYKNDFTPDTQNHKLLNAFLDRGSITNVYIVTSLNIFAYSRRIQDLRKAGWIIKAKRHYDLFARKNGVWIYTLVGHVSDSK